MPPWCRAMCTASVRGAGAPGSWFSPRLIKPPASLDRAHRIFAELREASNAPRGAEHTEFARLFATFTRVFTEVRDRTQGFAPRSVLELELGTCGSSLVAASTVWPAQLSRASVPSAFAEAVARALGLDATVQVAVGTQGRSSDGHRFDVVATAARAGSHPGMGSPGLADHEHVRSRVRWLMSQVEEGGCLVFVELLSRSARRPEHVPMMREAVTSMRSEGEPFHILAPCAHHGPCPMDEARQDAQRPRRAPTDCRFAQRLQWRRDMRPGPQQRGSAFEIVGFTYLVVQRSEASRPGTDVVAGRILTPPRKRAGHVMLDLCTVDGALEERVVSRKHGAHGDLRPYRAARESTWGDFWVGSRQDCSNEAASTAGELDREL